MRLCHEVAAHLGSYALSFVSYIEIFTFFSFAFPYMRNVSIRAIGNPVVHEGKGPEKGHPKSEVALDFV